jgi:hypothetical protein
MATYTDDVTTDPFGPMQLYKPDYQFLTQVYGTGQAQFDRGFNYVKSIYNSQLNNTMTSQDNQKHRQAIFKKISASLKDATTLDLSNPANIQYAQKLIEPISKDREFAYDMAFSKRQQSELQKLESARMSLDPKISAQYNEYSRRAIDFANQDMKSARRGDGSILKIAPQEFVPYQDIVADLNKAAIDQKLDIKIESADNRGYIIKQSNGKLAYKPYTNWAMQVIGNKYDRQFQQQGYVEAESMIRSKMQSDGVSRDEAIKTFTPEISKRLMNDAISTGEYSDIKLREINSKIDKFDEKYKGQQISVTSQAAQERIKLENEKNTYVAELAKSKTEEINLRDNADEYVASNLYNIFTNEAKKKTALTWAINQAEATKKIEISADTTWMDKFKEAHADARFYTNLAFEKQKFAYSQEQDKIKNNIEFLKMKYGAEGMKDMPSETYAGTYQSQATVYGTKVINDDLVRTQNQMYDTMFAPSNGLINVIYQAGKNDNTYISPIISKMRQIANGENVKLTSTELNKLVEFGKRTGIKIYDPSNQANAAYALRQIALDVYEKSGTQLETFRVTNQTKKLVPLIEAYKKARTQFGEFTNHINNLDKNYTNMAKEILDGNGNIKPMYEGAIIRGYTKSGTPIFDTTNLSDNMKQYLSEHTLDANYSSKSKPAGATLIAKNIKPEEYHQFFSYNSNLPEDVKTKLIGLNTESIEKIFGKNADMSYDPGKEEVIFVVKADKAAAKAAGLGDAAQGSYELRIPYSRVRNNASILSRPAKYLEDNTVKAYDINSLNKLLTNTTSTVYSPEELKALGMEYSVHGGNDANHRYGLYVKGTMLDPSTQKEIKFEHFEPGNPGDANLIHNTETWLNNMKHQYQTMRIQHDTQFDRNGVDLQDYDAFVNSIKF